MNILLLGGGGREHALAWKLAQSPTCDRLYAAPGNPGIAHHADCVALDLKDHTAVVAFCHAHAIGLVVIGPEAPLVDGMADSLRAAEIATFGPSRAAAQLEGSKAFTKALCEARDIPTAGWEHCTAADAAKIALGRFGMPVVVKADGLAAGKGVTIAATRREAEAAIDALFEDAGASVVIEEFLPGEEVSLFAITDGETVVPFGSAQDHKRIGEGDTGPNTGGMGAYSPATVLTSDLEARAMREIVEPTIAAMAAAGTPFVGVLYAGLMLTPSGPKLIEYNVRFGDPEAQVLMPRFSGDLAALLRAAATGTLADIGPPLFVAGTAIAVVAAASGYPSAPLLGGRVGQLPPESSHAVCFIAGLRWSGAEFETTGGRVLAMVGLGPSIAEARDIAYANLAKLDFPGGYWRRDIGWRELSRQKA